MKRKFDYSYLRGFIKEYFGTQEVFAKFLGIGRTALSERLNGNVPFNQDEIYKTINEAKEEKLLPEEVELLFFKR